MTLHAPAPWHFDGHGINDAEGSRIATLTQSLKFQPESDQLGNTLAAAPDLLAALEAIAPYIPDPNTVHGRKLVCIARAAIAKAKGGA